MSEEPAWWRGQAAGIPPRPVDPDGFPLWPTTTTTTVRDPTPTGELVPVGRGGLTRDLVDPAAHDAGATAVIEHLRFATDRLEQTAAQLSDARFAEARFAEAQFAEEQLMEAQLADARLAEAQLSEARLSAARLEEARLSAAGDIWPPPAMRAMRRPRDAAVTSPPPKRAPRKVRHARNPAFGLPAMLVIALLAGFFAWTSAEPFWLDMGQGQRGNAQITRCNGDGVLRRCYATFQSEAREAVPGVPLVGADDAPGAILDARMRDGGRIAYAGNPSGLRVRWTVGLALILLCGAALCWATGAGRLGRFRTRLAAYAVTTAAPLALGLGVIAACY